MGIKIPKIPDNYWYCGYKIELFPTDSQKEFIDRCIDVSRFVYNWTLDQENKQLYLYDNGKANKSSLTFFELHARFTKLRNENEFVKSVPHTLAKNAIMRAYNAYASFFKGITRRPFYRRKKDFTSRSFETREKRIYFEDNMFKLEGCNELI